MQVPRFDFATIESLSRVLGNTEDGLTGTQIDKYLAECSINDMRLNSTKWKKLNDALLNKQETDKCANNIVHFIQVSAAPTTPLTLAA